MRVAEWMRTLEQLQLSLNQTAADITRHEQTLASPLLVNDLSTERHTTWQRALERLGERLQDCQTQVDRAEQESHQAESALAAHETEMTHFREKVDRIRRQLAEMPAEV